MRSIVAPTYANIYMASFEKKFVYNSVFVERILSWWCYIDDFFCHLDSLFIGFGTPIKSYRRSSNLKD